LTTSYNGSSTLGEAAIGSRMVVVAIAILPVLRPTLFKVRIAHRVIRSIAVRIPQSISRTRLASLS
jgi:hypothetical protein